MQQITRGDYLKDLITIHVENHLPQALDELYSQFVFQCGEIQRFLTPAEVIKISFNEQESQKLTNFNVCYLAGITVDGHKETFNGSISFNTRGDVVLYEPPVSQSTTAVNSNGVSGTFSNCSQSAVVAHFSINYVPSKLSELENDTDFQSGEEVAASIAEHNESEEAHPYIQSVIQSGTEATLAIIGDLDNLTTSDKSSIVNAINSEVSAREESVSNAISTTEAYTDSVLQSATTAINTTIGEEVTARQNADNGLQGQIDALAAASDVTDIVGTYAELQAYDTQHLNNNDIIKVLSDSTHDNQPSYYRFNKTAGTFSYIGSESAAYTKAQSDSIFVTKTTTINNKPLSSDITLTYSDVDALSETYATTIASNTSAIATNTNAISTINGKIPTDASTTNKLVTASSIDNLANQDLSNLTSNGESRLHALKSYEDAGELLTDSEGLADVKKYAHSTFDKSKFTVVGSPSITDDGILTYTSPVNYVRTSSLNVKLGNTFVYKGSFNLTAIDSAALFGVIVCTDTNNTTRNFYCYIRTNSLMLEQVGGDVYNFVSIPNDAEIGKQIDFEIDLTSDKMTLKVTKDNLTNSQTLNLTTWTPSIINYISIRGDEYGYTAINANCDLKNYCVFSDGVPVFSGNKTGIDTIKPDDYTAVGTPTISADGVASGFSTSGNRLETGYVLNFTRSFELMFKVNISVLNGFYVFLGDTIFGVDYGKQHCWLSNSSLNDIGQIDGNTTILTNTDYYFKFGYANGSYYQKSSTDGINWINENSLSSNSHINVSEVKIGGWNEGNGLNGSIDLNAFKIYVDGNLVYQPCLKIPYTESKTGSKIVQSVYRDRVNDMYNQFGYAPYYTLSDTDFTLPQGELYGNIQQTLRSSTVSGINKNYLYSNRMQIQTGSCTSGVEVTLPKPFSDSNYALTVPYSAKSATAFTPTATGDWIAIGLGNL